MTMTPSAPRSARSDPASVMLEVLPRVVRLLQHAVAASGSEPLTLTQYRLLRSIETGCRRGCDVAARMDLSPATVSVCVEGLVRRGLVVRVGRAEDRRVVPLALTANGQRALASARERQRSDLERLLALLDPSEIAALTSGLGALGEAIDSTGRGERA